MCCCRLLSQMSPCPFCGAQKGGCVLWGVGCLLQQFGGLLAQGSKYRDWGPLWGMNLTLGNVTTRVSPSYFTAQLKSV